MKRRFNFFMKQAALLLYSFCCVTHFYARNAVRQCAFGFKKYLLILFSLFFFSAANAEKIFDFSATCQQAYQQISSLKINAGARLVQQDKIGLSAFKRNGFLDIQSDQMMIGWDGKRYVDASTFPASSLDGAAFMAACQKSRSNEQPAEGEAERVSAECQCRFSRFQVTGFTQPDLDMYTASLGENFEYPTGAKEIAWQALLKNAEDVGTGCDVASGKSQWPPAYFNHGDQPQQKLNFDSFLDACPAQDFILTNHKIGSPDRALSLCGCLAREMPTQGISQAGLDLVAQYYRNEISDADIEAADPNALTFHDKASEACLSQFPGK